MHHDTIETLQKKQRGAITMRTVLFLLILQAVTLAQSPITPHEMQSRLGRGFDVGWAEFPSKIEAYDEEEVIAIKERGFQTIRLRTNLPATEDSLFTFLDIQINHILNHGLIPVLAYHGGDVEENPSPENMQAAAEWWKNVAQHYADYPHELLFNLIVEITDSIKNDHDKINELYRMMTEEIRKTNPTRIILYAPKKISNPEYLKDLVIPDAAGNYAMVEWHFYAAGPDTSTFLPNGHPNPKKWTTGTSEEIKLLTDKIDLALTWSQEQHIPTWVGAWMPGNYNKGNYYSIEQQTVFASVMIESLERASIPWCVNAIHKFYNEVDNQWIDSMTPLVNILAPESPVRQLHSTNNAKGFTCNIKGRKLRICGTIPQKIQLFSLKGELIAQSHTSEIVMPKTAGLYIVAITTDKDIYYQRLTVK